MHVLPQGLPDSPDTARDAILKQHQRWVEAAGEPGRRQRLTACLLALQLACKLSSRAVSCLLTSHTNSMTLFTSVSGGTVACEEGVEVSPLVSYAGEGLEGVAGGRRFAEPFSVHLQASSRPAAST